MCTAILIGADRSSLGAPLLAKNRDLEYGDVRGEGVVVEDELDYVFKGFTFQGNLDEFTHGINEKGLSLAFVFVKIDKPGWEDDWEPIPDASAPQRMVGRIGREVLGRCATVEEALCYVLTQAVRGRCVGGTMFFADDAEGALIEAIDDEFAIRRFVSGVEARTNHFEVLRERGPAVDAYPSSYMRRERALDLLAARPVISPETLATVMGDHHPDPSERSICRHGASDHPLHHFTVASTIMIPKNANGVPELLYASGNPCRHRFASHLVGTMRTPID